MRAVSLRGCSRMQSYRVLLLAAAPSVEQISPRKSRMVQLSLLSAKRFLNSSTTPTSSPSANQGSERWTQGKEDGFNQFRQQQQILHRHSFYEKGSASPRGYFDEAKEKKNQSNDGSTSSSSSSGAADSSSSQQRRQKDERVYGKGSDTAQQRRQLRQQWEKSFFGRMHYEEGMHRRFTEAVESEEEEAFRQSIAGQSHAELFPDWPEDEEAPLPAFKRLRPSLQLQYIINRLSSGERRIRFAADYGSLSMMYQLNLGERMVKEAAKLLTELGWMNDALEARVEDLQILASKMKYDFDLD